MSDITDYSRDVSIHDDDTHSQHLEIDVSQRASVAIKGTDGKATTSDVGSSKIGLDVNIVGGGVEVSGGSLRYDKLTTDQALTSGSYVEIYEDTNGGKVFFFSLMFKNNAVDIKVSVDGTVILEINLNDLVSDYLLDASVSGQIPRPIYAYGNSKGLVCEPPGPATYASSFKIEARATGVGNYMENGIVLRSL